MRKLMFVCGLAGLFAAGLEAQSAKERLEQAPPAVDKALRERVNRFYQAHVDGKWREADAMVAEDTKDFFFAMQKSRYQNCEVIKTQYQPGFKEARVTVTCKGEWQFHNTKQPVVIPMTSSWKVVGKQWFWYVDQTPGTGTKTPFGVMAPGPEKNAVTPVGPPPGMPADMQKAASKITAQVTLSKDSVTFDPKTGGSVNIDVYNGSPGEVQLRSQTRGDIDGLTAKLDRNRAKTGEGAVLTVEYKASEKAPELSETQVYVEVLPFLKVYTIQVKFAK